MWYDPVQGWHGNNLDMKSFSTTTTNSQMNLTKFDCKLRPMELFKSSRNEDIYCLSYVTQSQRFWNFITKYYLHLIQQLSACFSRYPCQGVLLQHLGFALLHFWIWKKILTSILTKNCLTWDWKQYIIDTSWQSKKNTIYYVLHIYTTKEIRYKTLSLKLNLHFGRKWMKHVHFCLKLERHHFYKYRIDTQL